MVKAFSAMENAKYFSKKLETPEEVAELGTFLLTSKADYSDGGVIHIDGGFTNTK